MLPAALLFPLAMPAAAAAHAAPPVQASAPAPAPVPSPRPIRSGAITGDLYLPAASGRVPAILLLGGSEGGLGRGGARHAAALAAHGYAVLQLSYFDSPGQPAALRSIPIETFTRALDWLRAQPQVAGDRIGIVGTSKGAEAALLVASRRPDIRIAVLGAPSSVVWPGIDHAEMVRESSWTEGGTPVPFASYGWSGEWKGIHALYADGLADPANAAGAIPVERTRAAIVMICGGKDALWPACTMARAIAARLRQARHRAPVTLLAYPDAGHAASGPPIDADAARAATNPMLGGTVAATVAARADGWPRVLAALDAALGPEAAR